MRKRLLIPALLVLGSVFATACTPEEVQQYISAVSNSEVTAAQEEPVQELYVAFPSCREAVDYWFAGRDDLERAHLVVYRESRYVPWVISRTGARGCAQMVSHMRNEFLEGPWDDPYWNIKAMREAVDSWGWCHWDIVNYCKKGGQFGP